MKKIQSFVSCFLIISFLSYHPLVAQKKSIQIVKEYFSNADKGDVQAATLHFTATTKVTAPFSSMPFDTEGWKMVGIGFKQAFPDMQHQIQDIFTDGTNVAVRGQFMGTNTGPNMGKPATGNKVSVPFNTLFTMDKNLKIASITVEFDQLNFTNQLMGTNLTVSANAETTIRKLMKAVDNADEMQIRSLIETDAVHYFQGEKVVGDGLIKRVKSFKIGFPDIERKIEEVYVSGNTVSLRGNVTGTHKGVFMGVPPTGAKVDVPFLAIYKLSPSGKMQEGRIEFDRKSVEQQIAGLKVSQETLVKNIKTAYESLNAKDWNTFRSICNTTDYTDYSSGPMPIQGLENAVESYKSFFSMFPDYTFTIDKITIDGHRAILETSATGTNTGLIMGMLPATGKKINHKNVEIVTFDAWGKVTSHRATNPNEPFVQIGYGSLINPNTALIMDLYKNFGSGNIENLVAALASNVTWDVKDNPVVKNKKIYTNNSDVKMFFGELAASCEVTKFEPFKFVADGDHVMTAIHVEWKSKSTSKKWSSTFNHHFKIENNKVVWFQEVTTTPLELKGI